MVRVAIIGGSGLYKLLEKPKILKLDTPFGSCDVSLGEFAGEEVAFIPRHGTSHELPPFRVNYKANLYALNMLEVERVIATNAVGAINPDLEPGTILVPQDLIDMTKCREVTFYDGRTRIKVRGKELGGVIHVSMTPHTYCPEIRSSIIEAAENIRLDVRNGGIYVCTEGNRFETPAEIRAFSILGGDVVGMTGCPEASLARELALCYASISIVTNYAAGVSGRMKLTHREVLDIFSRRLNDLSVLLEETIRRIPKQRSCTCKDALSEFLQ
ncbi:MAG: S-methyl-5'-thioinosine phosphorylase [Candidatus Korarchaeum sp.]|nr:S-methyl-5'-thioinosine phosphorylase [Candidatus Korarchaeum sp.]MDW8035569.1 S-methyl-5'-thioinosine phosphorylase [Candidatus Korarchaeum sp.]